MLFRSVIDTVESLDLWDKINNYNNNVIYMAS